MFLRRKFLIGKARSFTNFHKADWEEFTAQTGYSLTPLYQPPALLGKKSSGVSSATPEDTISPAVMLGTIAALSPKLCDPSSRRETSAALMTVSTLPSSCWTGTSSCTSARKCKISGDPGWNPPTALPIPSATGPSSVSWAARGRVPHQTYQSPLTEKSNPVRRRLHKPSTDSLLPALPTRSDREKAHEGPPLSPPCGSLIQAIRLERRRRGNQECGLFHSPGA